MKLQNGSGDTLLTLRNYTNFDTLRVLGPDSTDTFNVYTAASGPSRNLSWTAVCPWAKKKSTDNPAVIHSPATQDPVAGIADLDYGTARFVVRYD
jgi:hypothetical protein